MSKLEALKTRLTEVTNIRGALGLLGWDQQVIMPEGGAMHRAAQMGTLSRIQHELFTADETGTLLEGAEAEVAGMDADSDDVALVSRARRDYDQATRLPSELVARTAQVTALAHGEWAKARAENDYAGFKGRLAEIVEIMVETAETIGYEDRIYDALLDQYEPGMKTAHVAQLFADVRDAQIPMLKAMSAQGEGDRDAILKRTYAADKQAIFGEEVAAQFGYNFERGRLDVAVHPFTGGTGTNDVRITTRYEENWLPGAMFGTMHEAGHGMYEQGTAQHLAGTYLAGGTSLGVHESQSRLWENIVGRSRGFWGHYYPRLQGLFPESLGDVSVDDFYRAINCVKPSFIRVEADEVTYNMHIIIRFELENEILEGKVSIDDAPAAWNAKYEQYLGITPPTDTVGILQDVHWSSGLYGYFPTYALGNLMSVPIYNKAVEAHPSIPDEIASGKFETLLTWLQENIYQHGQKVLPADLFERVTGETISAAPYVAYLQEKFGPLYNL